MAHPLARKLASWISGFKLKSHAPASPRGQEADDVLWLTALNARIDAFGLAPVELAPPGPPRMFRLRAAAACRVEFGAIVSVILYARDAEEVLENSAVSILGQTWRPLELIIIDDASDDATLGIAIDLVRRDARVKLLRTTVPLGRGAACNRALDVVTGHCLTSLLAGDWAHPEWIERWVGALLDDTRAPKVVLAVPIHPGLIGPSPGSSGAAVFKEPDPAPAEQTPVVLAETDFFREKLGSWDSVGHASEAELAARIQTVFPDQCAIISPQGLLRPGNDASGIGRASADHLKQYQAFYRAWHATLTSDTARLPFPHEPEKRRFPAPSAILASESGIRRPAPPPPLEKRAEALLRESWLSRARLNMRPAASCAEVRERPIVWMYWTAEGVGRPRPPYLEVCLESVRRHSECEVRICDERSARELLPELPDCFSLLIPAHQSDVFRVGVLARYGGLYLDADTFVLRPLAPLFESLARYELCVADWRPRHRDPREWYPVATGALGPARPGLPLMTATFEQQLRALQDRAAALAAGTPYPFGWTELLDDIFVRCYFEQVPEILVRDGAATWFTLAGGTQWWGGNLLHPLRTMHEIGGRLPDSELFTLANSLLPDEVKYAPIAELLRQDTILAHLIRQSLA